MAFHIDYDAGKINAQAVRRALLLKKDYESAERTDMRVDFFYYSRYNCYRACSLRKRVLEDFLTRVGLDSFDRIKG